MSFTNSTEHYGLPQYIGTDKPTQLGDFNMAMETIDKQMYKNAQLAGGNNADVSQLQTQVNTLSQSVDTANQNVSQLETQATTLSGQVQTVTENANSALSTAQSAQQSAQTANTTANSAQSTASQANTQGTTNAASIADLEARVSALEGDAPEKENAYVVNCATTKVTNSNTPVTVSVNLSELGLTTEDLSAFSVSPIITSLTAEGSKNIIYNGTITTTILSLTQVMVSISVSDNQEYLGFTFNKLILFT